MKNRFIQGHCITIQLWQLSFYSKKCCLSVELKATPLKYSSHKMYLSDFEHGFYTFEHLNNLNVPAMSQCLPGNWEGRVQWVGSESGRRVPQCHRQSCCSWWLQRSAQGGYALFWGERGRNQSAWALSSLCMTPYLSLVSFLNFFFCVRVNKKSHKCYPLNVSS